MRWLILIVIGILLAAAGVAWKRLHELKVENAVLAGKVENLESELAAIEEKNKAGAAESEKLRRVSSEVLTLRGEIGQLREKARTVDQVREENNRLRLAIQEKAAVKSSPATNAVNSFPREAWTFSGYGSPEAALVSAIWAMKEGNPAIYLESLSAEEQERMAKAWLNKSESEIASKHKKDVAAISGFRIVEKQMISDNEVQFRVEIEGVNRMETVSLKLSGNDWKFGGFLRPPP